MMHDMMSSMMAGMGLVWLLVAPRAHPWDRRAGQIPVLSMSQASRSDLVRRAFRLEWLTAAWMAIEAVVAIGSGISANSLSLIAFGADSVIELASAGVLRTGARGGGITRALRLLTPKEFPVLGKPYRRDQLAANLREIINSHAAQNPAQ
jgi:hypothetical protein